MSISDRLDQIEQRGVRAASLSTEDWTTPECLFLVENELPELVEAVRRRDAALRAVLDLHQRGPRCTCCATWDPDGQLRDTRACTGCPGGPPNYVHWPCDTYRAVTAALGEA